ncbi:ribose transport system permease protein [Clostridium algifaecis]|uniref:Ribose transport system permease protein n=1 Tax=Clostridium algifaecis TaxID=1472040 RepID=A0ABS4KTZ2_9CLOT|nr:ribose ABC transporter permease [Clostridium algifaecis]MBP2033510.1 ribose transport system permease protein [Clostridium algifaecis]
MNLSIKDKLLKNKAILALIALCILISIVSPRFLTISNISNVLTQVSVNAIIAIGMTFVILTGGIDLSVGSILAICGAVSAVIVNSTGSIFLAVTIPIIIGAAIGLFNGFFISKCRLQAFVATLATMTIFRGLTYVYTNGNPVSSLTNTYNNIANAKIGIIPLPVIFTIIITIIAYYFLNKTRFGRHLYAVGGNEDSARLSGIKTIKIKTIVYVVCGAAAGLSGIIATSRIGSASPNAGTGFELDAIASVVIGGTSLLGGEGSVLGTIIGALIIGVLNNGLNLLNVSPFYQQIVKGVVILLAVLADKKSK